MAFDPTTLVIDGWWRADFADPWTPTSSAGTSGTNGNLIDGTPPTGGTTVNGFTPASFSAASMQYLTTLNGPSFFFNLGSGSIAFLFNAASAALPSPAGQPYNDPGLVGLFGAGEIVLGFNSGGIRPAIYDGSYEEINSIPASTGAWHLAQMKWDGTRLYGRVDNGRWQSTAAGPIDSFTGIANVRIATSEANIFQSCDVLEVAFSSITWTDANFFDFGLYVTDRYALPGLGFWAPTPLSVVPDYLESNEWRRRRLEVAQQRQIVDSQISTFTVPPYKEPRFPDYLPRSGRTREYMRASLQQVTDVRGGLSPLPLARPGIDYGRAARPDFLDSWYRRRCWMRPDLQMLDSKMSIAPRDLGKTQLVVNLAVMSDIIDPDIPIRPARRELAARQPFEGRANILPIPLPQPGTFYGYVPPRLSRNVWLRDRMRTALLPFFALPEKIERTAPLADQEYPDDVKRPKFRSEQQPFALTIDPSPERVKQLADMEWPDAIPRWKFHAAQQKDTAQNLSPIPLVQSGIGYGYQPDHLDASTRARSWFAAKQEPDVARQNISPLALAQPGQDYGYEPASIVAATRLLKWFRMTQQKDTALPEFPAPLDQPGISYDYFPPRVSRPSPHANTLPQSDETGAFFGSTAAQITPVDLFRFPDRVPRPTLAVTEQKDTAQNIAPIALPQAGTGYTLYVDRIFRPVYVAGEQLFAPVEHPAPERTTQLADAEWIDRPWRAVYKPPYQSFTTDISPLPFPLPQAGQDYGWYPERVLRPTYHAEKQAFTTDVSPHPERSSPLADSVWVDRPWRPSFRVSWQLDSTQLSPLPIPLAQPGADRASFPERIVRPRLLAEKQPFTTDVPAAIIPLPQSGTGYGYHPERVSRSMMPARLQIETTNLSPTPERTSPLADASYPERVRRSLELAPWQIETTNLSPLPIVVTLLPGVGFGDYPSRVDRVGVTKTTYRDSWQSFTTDVTPNPIPFPQSGIGYGWYPERIDRAGVLRAYRPSWQLETTKLSVLPIPLPQSGAGYATYPDRVPRPSFSSTEQLFTTSIASQPEQRTPLDHQPSYQDAVRRPVFRSEAQQVTSLDPLPRTQLALTLLQPNEPTYPNQVLRPVFRVTLQLETTKLAPSPERSAPLADAVYPERAIRPIFRAERQLDVTSLSPQPEVKVASDWYAQFPERARRPLYSTTSQSFFTSNIIPEDKNPVDWSVLYPDQVSRPRLTTAQQQASAQHLPPLLEISGFDLAIFPEAVTRPRYRVTNQAFEASAPQPEQRVSFDWSLFQERVYQPHTRFYRPRGGEFSSPFIPQFITLDEGVATVRVFQMNAYAQFDDFEPKAEIEIMRATASVLIDFDGVEAKVVIKRG